MTVIFAAGALPALVALMGSNEQAVQKAAAKAVRQLSTSTWPHKSAIVAAGAVHVLNALLCSNGPALQGHAANILWNMCDSSQAHLDAACPCVSF